MKGRILTSFAVLVFAVASVFSIGAFAQTTEEGPGPSEQPSAPMEMGQDQSQQGPDMQASDAQPTEAQPGGPTGEGPATTDQGVARLSMIHGDVSTQRGDSGDWSAATLNQPVMTGDKVSTADGARTELQLDFANIFRLGPNSKANIANLTKKNIQIQLSQGIANYTVSKDSEAEPEIDTPNVSVHPAHHDGVFRIEIRPDGDTLVIVRKGEAQIATPQGSTEVRAGEMATVRGNADSAQYKISNAPDRDDWDRWNSDRDHMIENAQSWHHTNRYYTGAQDLDAYGSWRNVPDYGDVWYPNEGGDWAPYRDGNWVYEPYYGWTWVGYEPWGWAPYHYGRWLYAGGGWGWWPGPAYGWYRPFWAPAYVSFWGWGGGFGFGFGFGGWGGFGWLPIGPCDFFHPWWGGYRGRFGWAGRGFEGGRFGGFRPLHGGNRFSNIANIHNDHVFRAMSTVNAGRFGTHVGAVAATRAQLGGAHMMAGNLPVVPSRASLSASGRAAAPSTIRNSGSERFFGTHNNVARPVSFRQETANLRQTMQQSHVGGVPAGGRSFGGETNAMRGGMNAGKPSAGSFQGREGGNGSGVANRTATEQGGNRGSFRPPTNTLSRPGGENSAVNRTSEPNRGGFRPFTPPNSTNRATENNGSNRSFDNRSFENNRGFENGGRTVQSQPGQNRPSSTMQRDGFRPFTPPSHSEVSRGESNASSARGGSGSYWNRTAPSSSLGSSEMRGSSQMHSLGPVYGGSERGSSSGRSSRPQLDMRQPIVRGPSYGGSRSMPSYGGSRGVPSYGGSHSAPSYGGGHSAPSGGGHMSAPSGGHSSGGGHASSGGGGHSSGGGSHGGGHR